MERLTRTEFEGTTCEPYVYGGIEHFGDSYGGEVVDRLSAYEDTNFTPEQMLEIDKDYRELCKKMAKYETIIAKFGCYEDGHPITCLHCPHVLEGSKCECRYTELL